MFGWFTRLTVKAKIAAITATVAVMAGSVTGGVVLASNMLAANTTPAMAKPDAPTTTPSPVPSTKPPAQSSCLPDLAYTTRTAEAAEAALFLRTSCGKQTKQITASYPDHVQWSADGQSIIYDDMAADYESVDLFIGNQTGATRQLTDLQGRASNPSWSPNGQQIAFLYTPRSGGSSSYQAGLYVIGRNGSTPRHLSGITSAITPVWSSDGTKIFVSNLVGQSSQLQQITISSGQTSTLLDLGQSVVSGLALSPDGRSLLYGTYDSSGTNVQLTLHEPATSISTPVRSVPGGSFAIGRDWNLYYGVYEVEGQDGGSPTDPKRLGIHRYDTSTDTDVVVTDNVGISSLNVAKTGTTGPTPIKFLPNYEFVSLGDSYSSGEGVPVKSADGAVRYIVGTDTDTNKCHRSMGAYPVLAHQATAKGSGFIFKACSGAVIEDFWKPYSQNHGGANPGEVPQLNWLNARTKVVTLTIGGNDAHFGEVMEYCTQRAPYEGSCRDEWQGVVNPAIETLIDPIESRVNYAGLFAAIRSKAPNAKVVIVGYPNFFAPNRDGACSTGYQLKFFYRADMSWINSQIERINRALEERAREQDFTYVKSADLLHGHELCTAEPWLNDFQLPIAESFHPNVKGQAAFATAVAGAIAS